MDLHLTDGTAEAQKGDSPSQAHTGRSGEPDTSSAGPEAELLVQPLQTTPGCLGFRGAALQVELLGNQGAKSPGKCSSL